MTTCLVKRRGHMTKWSIYTQRSAINFSCPLPLNCLITRDKTLLLLTFNFSSLPTLPILLLLWSEQKYSKAISNCVLADTQLHLTQNNQRLLQIVFYPKFFSILSKLFWDQSRLFLCQNSSSVSSRLNYSTEVHPAVNLKISWPIFGIRNL